MFSRNVVQLCSDYATLDRARVAVDEHIQRAQCGGVDDDFGVDAGLDKAGRTRFNQGEQAPGAADGWGTESEPEFDKLWVKLEEILAQEAELLKELAAADATTTNELHRKAVILESLLLSEDARQESSVRALSQSIVRDITRLFR